MKKYQQEETREMFSDIAKLIFVVWCVANVIYTYFSLKQSWGEIGLIGILFIGIPILITLECLLYFIKFLVLPKGSTVINLTNFARGSISIINCIFYVCSALVEDSLWRVPFWGSIAILIIMIAEFTVAVFQRYKKNKCKKQ